MALAMVARAPDLRVIDLLPVGTNNTWRLRWNSIPGADYQVQRAKDDRLPVSTNQWLPVVTVRAASAITSADDAAGSGAHQRFYRVIQLTNDQSLVVSPVEPGNIAGGGSGGATLRIITGGTQTVSSVVFFDQGNVIGNGVPGIDSSWSLNLPGG